MRSSRIIIWVMMVVIVVFAMADTCKAVNSIWIGSTGNWFSPVNWQYTVPETSSDNAYIDNGGTVEITSSVTVFDVFAGYSNGGTGTINHTDGTLTVGSTGGPTLYLGYQEGSTGTYNLSGTGNVSGIIYVGKDGTGTFNHSSGTTSGTTYIGSNSGSGTYNLSGTGQVESSVHVGEWVTGGTFNQTGGTVSGYSVYIGRRSSGMGIYNMEAGELSPQSYVIIGASGTGTFTHSGGTVNVPEYISIGSSSGSTGTYNLSGAGQVTATGLYVGGVGTGTFNHTGGTNSSNSLTVGNGSGGTGTYSLSGTGQLSSTNDQIIGNTGIGIFNQSGGINNVGGKLILGSAIGSSGRYTVSGGTLTAQEIQVGYFGTGRFDMDNPATSVTVSSKLFFGVDSVFTATPSSTIRMQGSLDNWNKDETSMSGLNNLTLIFEGGSVAGVGTFEAAGQDIGAVMAGFDKNFALAELILGDSDIGQVQLVDWRDNMIGSEALYVKDFILGNGSYLDLNGLNLYYQTFTDYGGTIDLNGGTMTLVPEPTTLLLLGLGGIMLRKKN